MNSERINLLEKYIKEEPFNPFNRYALAMEYYEEAPGKALSILRELIVHNQDYLPTYFKLAHLLWEDEIWEEAAKVFQKGIALADKQNDQKALHELKAAYQNFQFDYD